ncbi:MAG: glycogen debranching protein GlgX [Roseburia sp.]
MENRLEKQEQWGGLQPLDEIDGFLVRPGFYNRSGATIGNNGISFTVNSFGATSCTLLLFRPKESEPFAKLQYPESYHIGNTYSMFVFGLRMEEFEYAFQLDGPYDPAKGKLFDKNHILLDPYARAVTGQRHWGEKPEGGKDFVYHARVVQNSFDWGNTRQLETPFEDLIIYEMHVRGFTMDASSGVTAPGTYEGLRQKIPYLRDLGINAVELMPIFEFDEMEGNRFEGGERLYNYWGYNTVCFFAPNTGYTSVREHNHEGEELKRLILELKENGIEVILDVVFNHTAEGNEHGPVFSFKGIDNDIYYMLTPEGYYYNFSGCGNVMNCNHPAVIRFIVDCLRYWVTEYRVDGFRFDLASILSRGQNGAPMENPPILQSLACDPILGKVKLIAEAWDAGGLYQVGNFPSWSRWAEWNGRYRDDMRRFLKGDGGMAGAAITRITGSRDLYDPVHRGESASVNFLTCHDGFTLYDLYSYNQKHNEKNGWDNTDGDNNGNSWNCGAEGETDDPQIEGLRRRMVKNAFATLMCSRGPAMFYAGDEFCNTQLGNNNAYCQDNIISWLDWSRLEKYEKIHDFFRYMIAFRKRHPILRKTTKTAACGLPDISTHNGTPWNVRTDNNCRLIGIMYAGRDEADSQDDMVFYGMNAYWEPLPMQLPDLPAGLRWKLCINTNIEYEDGKDMTVQTDFREGKYLTVPPRTVVVLESEEIPVETETGAGLNPSAVQGDNLAGQVIIPGGEL